ncbi:MAG TPA: hypothetical protein VFS05_15525 [Gemmatimonadaceae bacterium]|nr:hypothetical protein [Gemmatimonadaceae bacterium]
MSDLLAPGWLASAHLAVSALAVLWNIVIAGRIARWRAAPRSIAALSAFGGLLIAPAVLLAIVGDYALAGRSLYIIAWVWPAVTILIAAQALIATARGYVPRLSGVPIVLYDLLVAVAATTRWAIALGVRIPEPLLTVVAADAAALELGAHPEAVLLPLYLHVPLLAAAVTARRWRLALAVRGILATLAATWATLILLAIPGAHEAVRGYARLQRERLQERPQNDFAIGLKLFPSLGGDGPPPLAIANDLELARRVDAQVLAVYIEPRAATAALLDSLARVLDESRRGGRRLIAALDVGDDAPVLGPPRGDAYFRARTAEVERIVSRLRPDYLVPAVPRPGVRRRVPLRAWQRYLAGAAAATHRVRPRTRVLAAVGGFGARDSAVYAWAAQPSSGIDAIGFRIFPSARGALSLDARLDAAERWMRGYPSPKEHWVLEAGGVPLAHGERSQALAIRRVIAWATRHPGVKGAIVYQAGDYESPVGLRATGGRLRPATATVERAVRAMGESGGS